MASVLHPVLIEALCCRAKAGTFRETDGVQVLINTCSDRMQRCSYSSISLHPAWENMQCPNAWIFIYLFFTFCDCTSEHFQAIVLGFKVIVAHKQWRGNNKGFLKYGTDFIKYCIKAFLPLHSWVDKSKILCAKRSHQQSTNNYLVKRQLKYYLSHNFSEMTFSDSKIYKISCSNS